MIEKTLLLIARAFSSVIFIVLKYVLRYRYGVIRKNLQRAFPEKAERERQRLMDHYYAHVADLFVEPFLFYLAPASVRKRLMTVEGFEVFNELYAHKKNVVILTSHYGNWEYLIDLPTRTDYCVTSGYSPVKSKWLNDFLIRIRSRFGANLIPKQQFYRGSLNLLRTKGRLNMIVVIGDQRPAPGSRKYSLPFFGMETDVQIGAERIARTADAAVVMLESVKIGRFKYRYHTELLDVKANDPLAITTLYFAKLEKAIRHSPVEWLWSHDRWKGRSALGVTVN